MLVSIPCVGCIEFYSRKYNAHMFIDVFHKLVHHLNNKLVFKTIEKKKQPKMTKQAKQNLNSVKFELNL